MSSSSNNQTNTPNMVLEATCLRLSQIIHHMALCQSANPLGGLGFDRAVTHSP